MLKNNKWIKLIGICILLTLTSAACSVKNSQTLTPPPAAASPTAEIIESPTPAKPEDWSKEILQKEARALFTSGENHLLIEFLDDDLLHFEFSGPDISPDLNKPIYSSIMVSKTDYSGPTQFSAIENTLESKDLRVEVNYNLCLTISDIQKSPALVLNTTCPSKLDHNRKLFSITQESSSDIYGLGQQFITPGESAGNWMGKVRFPGMQYGNAMVSWDSGMAGNTQFPIAYFVGKNKNNYAIFLDNQYAQQWDFRSDPFQISVPGNAVRFYVMSGPNLQDLRKDYLELTGTPPVPPKKMLGLWVSEYGFDNWQELEDKLQTLRENHFPVDGFVLDLQWFGGITSDSEDSRMGSLSWDLKNFPNPETKIAELRDQEGLGIITIEEPYISKGLPEYSVLADNGYLVRNCEGCEPTYLSSNPWWGKGGMMDWTNEEGSAYWHDLKREPLINAGVIGHWTDLGEPEAFNLYAWYSGISDDYEALNMHPDVCNLYNLKWSQSIFEGYQRNAETQRPFILSRSGAPGSQRYGVAMWSGDISSNLTTLASQMNTQMQMSMSGIDYYGSDIGGFYRQQFTFQADMQEMYTQWFASSMASDIPARPHVQNLCNCKETAPDRIGDFESNLQNIRQRYMLSPYLYSLTHSAYWQGDPVFPPLVYYFQDDPQVRKMADEKMIGPSLLFADVAEKGAQDRNVYLPAGEWYNFHTHQWIQSSGEDFGPFSLYPNGIYTLPMFARAGAIVPQMYVDDQTMNILGKRLDGSIHNELIISVFSGQESNDFTLYEDDGQTTAYQNGELRTTRISQSGNQVTIFPAAGSFAENIQERSNILYYIHHQPDLPTAVKLNGELLPQLNSETDFEAAEEGWFVSDEYTILAKSPAMNVNLIKTFEFDFQ